MASESSEQIIVRVLDRVRAHQERIGRRARVEIVVVFGLLTFVFLYMAYVFSWVKKLDAEWVVTVAATEVEAALPALKTNLTDFALQKAPDVVEAGKEILLKLPAELRKEGEAILRQRIREELQGAERRLNDALQVALKEQLELLDSTAPPGTSEEQKLDMLLENVMAAFREKMSMFTEEMYVDYKNRIDEVDRKFERLLTAKDLSEREKIQKELIQCWMVLVHKHGITTPGEED